MRGPDVTAWPSLVLLSTTALLLTNSVTAQNSLSPSSEFDDYNYGMLDCSFIYYYISFR